MSVGPQRGFNFVIYIGDGASPEVFTKLGSFRSNTLTFNGELVDVTDKNQAGWRLLMTGAGLRSLTMSGSGIFTDTADEETLRSQAFGQVLNNYQMRSDSGKQFEGAFLITQYERGGEHNSEETFSATLESSGAIVHT